MSTVIGANTGVSGSNPTPSNTESVGVTHSSNMIVDPSLTLNKNEPKVQYYVKFSFVITYILLLTTATITFIEAIRTKVPSVRHILNLETCISVVAGYFYSVFVGQIDKYNEKGLAINWADITQTRYIDWSITTPMMLLTLCLVLGSEIGVPLTIPIFLTVTGLNYIMLYVGYLGEAKVWSRGVADLIGFAAFFAMFGLIFKTFVAPKYSASNYVLFFIYFCVWSLYGVVYMFEEEYKNLLMNILDFTAKCFVGLGLWAYYTKIIRI
jgi:bacteriorhodopsin